MAGIIAGRDAGSTPSTYVADEQPLPRHGARLADREPQARRRPGQHRRVAGHRGHRLGRRALPATPGLNIRVLNLSFGTDSTQDYRLDPLAHAAEVAWNQRHRGGRLGRQRRRQHDRPVQPGVRPGRARRRCRRTPRAPPTAPTTGVPGVLAARQPPPRASGPPTWSRPAPRSSACGLRARSSTSCTARPARWTTGSSRAAAPRRPPRSSPAPPRCCSRSGPG